MRYTNPLLLYFTLPASIFSRVTGDDKDADNSDYRMTLIWPSAEHPDSTGVSTDQTVVTMSPNTFICTQKSGFKVSFLISRLTEKANRPNEVQKHASARTPKLSSASYYLDDLTHPSCCDTNGIYHNMCLPSLVKICPIVLEICRQKHFCNLFRHRVTLTFDLLTPKVDRFMPLLCGPLVLICIEIGSFPFKIYCVHEFSYRTDGRTHGWMGI